MKRLLFLACLICMSIVTFAQDKVAPDYKAIEKDINNAKSEFYYPTLMQHFQNGDDSVSVEACRHLYYGFVFQTQYNPYSTATPEEKALRNVNMPTSEQEAREILDKAKTVLKNDPFNIDVLMIAFYLTQSDLLQDSILERKYSNQLGMLLNAISSTGDGLSEQSAFHVINISHEYALLQILGLSISEQSLIGNCDVMTLQENDFNVEKMYFNVSQILKYENALFGNNKSKKKSKNNK